jgi:hypothetical protein
VRDVLESTSPWWIAGPFLGVVGGTTGLVQAVEGVVNIPGDRAKEAPDGR